VGGVLLDINSVSRRFGGTLALNDVSLHFPFSSIVGIAGPNGAGKTTLLDVLSGFERPDLGSIVVCGIEVVGRRPWDISRLGLSRLFQEVRLSRSQTALDNVKLAYQSNPGESPRGFLRPRLIAAYERETEQAALRLLESLSLNGLADSIAATLSYGQQKLVALACCLASDAKIYLLDEPFAGLAPSICGKVGSIFNDLRARGCLVLIVEHDMLALQQCADRLIIMAQGEVRADGSPDVILRNAAVQDVLLA